MPIPKASLSAQIHPSSLFYLPGTLTKTTYSSLNDNKIIIIIVIIYSYYYNCLAEYLPCDRHYSKNAQELTNFNLLSNSTRGTIMLSFYI